MTQQFTASEVRTESCKQGQLHRQPASDMLNAFADLLEAQEKVVPIGWICSDDLQELNSNCGESDGGADGIEILVASHPFAMCNVPVYTHSAPSDADRLAEALRWIMRTAGDAKEPCGDDPESPAAIRNGVLASISQAAAQSLGIVQGPSLAARTPWTEGEKAHFKAAAELVAQREAAQARPPAASVTECDFTTDEVNECFDHLVDDGPRLIPIEAIQQMREHCLLAAQENPNG